MIHNVLRLFSSKAYDTVIMFPFINDKSNSFWLFGKHKILSRLLHELGKANMIWRIFPVFFLVPVYIKITHYKISTRLLFSASEFVRFHYWINGWRVVVVQKMSTLALKLWCYRVENAIQTWHFPSYSNIKCKLNKLVYNPFFKLISVKCHSIQQLNTDFQQKIRMSALILFSY